MSRIGILGSVRSGDLISAFRQAGFHLIRIGGPVGVTREVCDRENALANTRQTDAHSFSTETAVAFITAKTLSPSLRFIRFTEPVVIIDVTVPAAVRITTSETTLSE
jgi:hypothetical protein